MSHTAEIRNTQLEMVVITDEEEPADSPAMLVLYNAVQQWNEKAALSDITTTRDCGNPMIFAHRTELKNGNICDEVWMMADAEDIDPIITVAQPDGWQASTFDFGAIVREHLIALNARVGLISFTVAFP